MKGGPNIYGHRIGILMIHGRFPRPPGAIGNAESFQFPVLYHVVPGGTGEVVVRQASRLSPNSRQLREIAAPWIEGARLLEQQGCRAITTSCGFAILFQDMLAAAVSVPVWSSSLLLGSFVQRGLAPGRKLGIVTAEAAAVTPSHFTAAGIDPARCAMIGMEGCREFAATTWNDQQSLDIDLAEEEAVSVAQRLASENPELGAVLLECSLLPPYAAAIQKAVNVPVFDFTHLVRMAHDAAGRRPFPDVS
ncbi:aspartate/glutamate racemase family protein [Aureimonas sp. OT7]|uniref:aspartate/glutamate racemase family protein n=1 Tax=Aureimonas sp. OT7 TaxID=2816454 RepID=UPI0017853761|nr:aspartate/glutamate racemase family protein [Aureimonas sp. OT7]QOG07279.1 aspartate/glutamate racemase family protein [Aureimonas sp. OT7]